MDMFSPTNCAPQTTGAPTYCREYKAESVQTRISWRDCLAATIIVPRDKTILPAWFVAAGVQFVGSSWSDQRTSIGFRVAEESSFAPKANTKRLMSEISIKFWLVGMPEPVSGVARVPTPAVASQ